MTDLKSAPIDPYDAVLADLRARRAELDSAIQMLEKLRDARLGVVPAAPTQVEAAIETEIDAGAFLGMSIVDATKKLLKARKKALTNSEILKELTAGGIVLTGADPLNVVGSVLTRRFNQVGDVVRVARGTWGLKEWYPGRNFKLTGKVVEIEPSADGNPLSPILGDPPTTNSAPDTSTSSVDENPFAEVNMP